MKCGKAAFLRVKPMHKNDINNSAHYSDNCANPHRRKHPDPTPVNYSTKFKNDKGNLKKATGSNAAVIGAIIITHF